MHLGKMATNVDVPSSCQFPLLDSGLVNKFFHHVNFLKSLSSWLLYFVQLFISSYPAYHGLRCTFPYSCLYPQVLYKILIILCHWDLRFVCKPILKPLTILAHILGNYLISPHFPLHIWGLADFPVCCGEYCGRQWRVPQGPLAVCADFQK